MRQKNQVMAWIDYRPAYNMAHQTYIDSLELYKISDEVIKFIEKTMENWRVELTARGKSFAGSQIQRGIFQILWTIFEADEVGLKQMEQRTRKHITMHNALHHRDDGDRLYVLIKGRRRLASIEDWIDASMQKLEDYIKMRKERLC